MKIVIFVNKSENCKKIIKRINEKDTRIETIFIGKLSSKFKTKKYFLFFKNRIYLVLLNLYQKLKSSSFQDFITINLQNKFYILTNLIDKNAKKPLKNSVLNYLSNVCLWFIDKEKGDLNI